MGVERRRARRAPIVARVEIQTGGSPFIVMAQNISVGGMLLRCASPLDEGTRIQLRFTLPGRNQETQISGTVQHISPGAFVGVRFDDLQAADLDAIKQYMEKI